VPIAISLTPTLTVAQLRFALYDDSHFLVNHLSFRQPLRPHPVLIAVDLLLPAAYHSLPQRVATSVSLSIDTREVGHVTVVDVTGRIVLGDETDALRATIQNLIREGKKKIVLNLAGVDYIDSSGVGELVSGFTSVRNAGGELKLLNLSKKVHDVLNVTKLYTVFDIKDDEFTAVKSFDYFFAK
jgi:anti-sigma B factor antagonist